MSAQGQLLKKKAKRRIKVMGQLSELTVSQCAKEMGHTRDWVYGKMALWRRSKGAYGLPYMKDEESGVKFILWRDVMDYQARRQRMARDV